MTQTFERSDEHYIDEVAHPAARQRSGLLTARQTVAVVVVALVTAALLDSHALLRAGEGMTPGHTRSTTLAVAQPLDRFAESTGLNRPRSAFDDALGRDDSAGGVITGGVVPPPLPAVPEPSVDVLPGPGAISSSVPAASDSTSTAGHPSSPAPATSPAKGAIPIRTPTRQRPLQVLVTGDSLSTYVAEQMDQLAQGGGLVRIKGVWADGTGLSNPSFYNWQKAAASGVREVPPGGRGDGHRRQRRLEHDRPVGSRGPGRHRCLGRRVRPAGGRDHADVSRRWRSGGLLVRPANGQGQVCGTGCTARSTPPPPGPRRRWRERSTSTSIAGPPSTVTTRRRCPSVGHLVQHARQPDGVHWTLDGSLLPASLELAAISRDLGHSLS